MADLKLTPGVLNITKVFADGLTIELDFNVSLDGFSFNASVVNGVTRTETTITVTTIDLASGRIRLTLAANETPAIPIGKHTWALRWVPSGGMIRTILAGNFEVTA